MSNIEPELIADYGCVIGENPLWHAMERRLYWLDISTGRMFRYHPDAGTHERFYKGDVVGGFTVQADGALLLFMERGAIKALRGAQLTTIVEEIPDEVDSRFNDVIADPLGRVFCGTMPSDNHLGSLYRLDLDGTLTKVLGEIGGSNGMGFTPDRRRMYYTDSAAREIYIFDYTQTSGEIANQELFTGLPKGEGTPDGMTVDSEGYVWSAIWDGSRLARYSPDGNEVMRIPFPAKKVSSVTFGGEEYDKIYVTTAGGNKKEEEGQGAGGLFGLRLGIRGLPEYPSRIRV